MSGFDEYADDYDRALDAGLSASGESKDYFAAGRVEFLRERLTKLEPRRELGSVLDYGCGTGSTIPLLQGLAPKAHILGVDVSIASLNVAESSFGSDRVRFKTVESSNPRDQFDLAYCNGIFHHIEPHDRRTAARYVFDALAPGGYFAFWENNPWNPGTRWVMSRIPFDRDAIPLSAIEARKLLGAAGFELVRTDFLFIFPRSLRKLRPLEQHLSRLPLGGQYQVLCRKPQA
jgi:SAM-dependent methyltransferase